MTVRSGAFGPDAGATDPRALPEKATTATRVYGEVKRDILKGVLKPGEKLQIDAVAGRYGAGTNPVREALNRLSAERLVDREDQRGFFVPPISLDHFREIVKTRCWLEGIAIEESLRNRTEDWEDVLVVSLNRLMRTPFQFANDGPARGEVPDNTAWDGRHRAFHLALIQNCGSSWLLSFCAELMDQADRYRHISKANSWPRRQSNDEHRLLLDLALAGDVAATRDQLVAHYRLTLETFEAHVAQIAAD